MDLSGKQRELLESATHLNIGCGHDYRHGYLNIDMDESCNPDIVLADNDFSAIPKNKYEYAVVANIIEHIPRQYMMGALLEWTALLKEGGKMWLETSNPLKLAQQMEEEPNFVRHYNWLKMMFGNQAQTGDFHFNGFTEICLDVYLNAAGLKPGEYTYIDGWVICTEATKEWDWQELSLAEDLTDIQFIERAYRFFLTREPDENGIAYHTHYLAEGGSRREVLKVLASSEERMFNTAQRLGI
jgi:predicted SAM-dependent methyltransferase